MDRRGFVQGLGLAAASSAATYWAARRSRFSGGYYVQMGTSVTAGATPSANITPTVVGDRLGFAAVNVGFPGACAGTHKFPDLNPISLYSLVDSIVSGDWSEQQKNSGDQTRDIALSRLMTAALKTITHLGLEYGTNDFHYSRQIGNNSDRTKETFKGALNYSIQKLLASNPQMQVFLITPAWMLNEDDLDSDEYPNSAEVFLREYVDAMVRTAELNHIPCLDMWRRLGINKSNYKTFTFDGTHPTDLGAKRRGELIASFMNATF